MAPDSLFDQSLTIAAYTGTKNKYSKAKQNIFIALDSRYVDQEFSFACCIVKSA